MVGGRYGRYDERWEVSGGGRTSLFGRRWMELSHYTWQSIFMCLTFVSLDPQYAPIVPCHHQSHREMPSRFLMNSSNHQDRLINVTHLKTTIIKISMVDG